MSPRSVKEPAGNRGYGCPRACSVGRVTSRVAEKPTQVGLLVGFCAFLVERSRQCREKAENTGGLPSLTHKHPPFYKYREQQALTSKSERSRET